MDGTLIAFLFLVLLIVVVIAKTARRGKKASNHAGRKKAKRALILSACENRRRNHTDIPSLPSRFLEEIPKELFDEEDPAKELSGDEMVDKLRLLRERLAQKTG